MRNCELAYKVCARGLTRPTDNLGTPLLCLHARSSPIAPGTKEHSSADSSSNCMRLQSVLASQRPAVGDTSSKRAPATSSRTTRLIWSRLNRGLGYKPKRVWSQVVISSKASGEMVCRIAAYSATVPSLASWKRWLRLCSSLTV